MAKKIGVVIFNNKYYSAEGLAALQWASSVFPLSKDVEKSQLVRILLVKEVLDLSEIIGPQDRTKEQLTELVREKGENNEVRNATRRKWAAKFDGYISKFGSDENVSGKSYEGPDVQQLLQRAIKDLQLDTLVLGMAAVVRSTLAERTDLTPGLTDLLLNSQCSVVFVKIDPQSSEADDDDDALN